VTVLRRFLSFCSALLLISATAADAGGDAPGYDMNSWKFIIADDCRSFFDGCNQCVRDPGKEIAACTRMYCAEYQRPRCRDDEDAQNASARPGAVKSVDYACADDAGFSVYYREFAQDDQRISLRDDEVMLRDAQNQTLYRLRRERSASGEKYGDSSGFVFFAKGDEAMVLQHDERLYSNCKAIR